MLKVKNRPIKRQLAVIESPTGLVQKADSQMILATQRELEMYRKTFPYLTVRWAEPEDQAKWRFAENLFDENYGGMNGA